MDIKEAVKAAKDHVQQIFSTDGGSDFALEEVDFNRSKGEWLITVSFKREHGLLRESSLTSLLKPPGVSGEFPRFQKVVRIKSESGEILSVKNREARRAA